MRVLFVALPERAHFMPMVSLAWALRSAGHEVRVASLPAFADTITRAGLTAVPLGRDTDLWTLIQRRDPDWVWQPSEGLPEPYEAALGQDDLDWDRLRADYAEIVETWHKPANFPLIAGLVEFARQWEPDLVLWEPLAYAGAIAAKACGAAHGRLLWCVDAFGVARERFLELRERQPEEERVDPLGEWLAGYGRKYGFEFSEDMATGQFTVEQLPEELGVQARGLEYVPMRYVPYGGPSVVPSWVRERPERRRIALTLGISTAEHDAPTAVDAHEVLTSLSRLDAEVVATVPEAEQEKVGPVPDNVRMVSYVPLASLAPTCDAVVNHAGLGTVLTMALYGVPQVTLPWDFDAPELARRTTGYGGGLTVHPREADGDAVREAVRRVLEEPRFRDRAEDLKARIRARPTPHEVASTVEALTARHRNAR